MQDFGVILPVKKMVKFGVGVIMMLDNWEIIQRHIDHLQF